MMMIATMIMMLWRLKIQNYDNIEDNVVKDDADDDDDDDELGRLVKGCVKASPHRISPAPPDSINLTSLASS